MFDKVLHGSSDIFDRYDLSRIPPGTRNTLNERNTQYALEIDFFVPVFDDFIFQLRFGCAKRSQACRFKPGTVIGSWHLVSVEEPGADGKLRHVTDRAGQLIYTRDGHMSVQLMYPRSESAVSNDYVLNGYEASFGSYDVNEDAHTVTHHVQASVTRGLIGKHLTRAFQFSNGNLIIKSVRADEHWSVTWQHD